MQNMDLRMNQSFPSLPTTLRIFPSHVEPDAMSSFSVLFAASHFSDLSMISWGLIPSRSSATCPIQMTSISADASFMWSANRKLAVPSLFFVHNTLIASIELRLHAGIVLETSNWVVNDAGGGFWRQSLIIDSPLFLNSWATMSGVLLDLGRIALAGLGGTPRWIREPWSFNSPLTSYASNGNGVKDDLEWTEKPVFNIQSNNSFSSETKTSPGKQFSIKYSQFVRVGNLALLIFLRRINEPMWIIFSLWIKVQRFSSQIIALMTLPQRAKGAWIVSSSLGVPEMIFSIWAKTCSGGSPRCWFEISAAILSGSLQLDWKGWR